MPEMPEMPAPAAMPAPPAIPGHAAASGAPQTAEDLDAMREERYKAMRERAAKSGVELPETPPWKLLTEEERYARWEKMRNATPEERAAMREQNWAEMRKRAAERGIELPETPPWKQAQQRREEMKAKWESYRQTIEQMTEEQREAAAAVFGKPPAPPARAMPRKMPAQTPYGRDFGAMRPPMPNRMPYPKMMPGQGAGGPSPWSRGAGDMMQPPPPPSSGYKRGW
jgi:hypothetical protein